MVAQICGEKVAEGGDWTETHPPLCPGWRGGVGAKFMVYLAMSPGMSVELLSCLYGMTSVLYSLEEQ